MTEQPNPIQQPLVEDQNLQLPKLDLNLLRSQVQNTFKAKKKNPNIVGLGLDHVPIPDFIPAPQPIQDLIGLPGYPLCRVSMVCGRPDSGKTTLGMLALVEAQRRGYYPILVDTEKKFDFDRYDKMGGNAKNLIKVMPSTIEDGFLGLNEYLNAIYGQDPSAKSFVVWDSMGGTPSKAEREADADETTQLATAAKVIKKNLRVFVQDFDYRQCGMLMINQMYANIGSHGYSSSGGEGVDFFSAIILQMIRMKHFTVQSGGQKYKTGVESRVTAVKNHLMRGDKVLYQTSMRIKAYSVEAITKRSVAEPGESEE